MSKVKAEHRLPVKGERVGAVLSSTPKEIYFLGYGVFQGNHPLPEIFGGLEGFENPKMTLDNGDTVWGAECWWSAESEMKTYIEVMRERGVKIIDTRIGDHRGKA